MAEIIGETLRRWRAAQGLTLGGLALKSGLAASTLSRWEAAKRRPNLHELEVALDALKVTPQQRIEALLRLETSHAALRLRELCGDAPPTAGDLLRAMRGRLHLTQAETACRIGVTQTMLAKWERSEDWPSAVERLTALCQVIAGASG